MAIDYERMPNGDLVKLKGTPYEVTYTKQDQDRWQERADAMGAALSRKVTAKVIKPRSEPKMSTPEREFLRLAWFAVGCSLLAKVEHQPEPFELDGNTTYRPDFQLRRLDNKLILVETKARWMHSENVTRLKLRQCSTRYPEHTWWLARWHKNLPWKIQAIEAGVIRRKPIVVPWIV